MLSLIIYLLSIIEGITVVMFTIAIITVCIVGGGALWYIISDEQDNLIMFTAKVKKYLVMSVVLIVLGVLIPQPKTIAAMYLLPKMVNGAKDISQNENVKQLPDKVLTILNGKLDEYISDLSSKKAE